LARRFALAAIRAQPAAYLRTVASDVMLGFLVQDRPLTPSTMHFTQVPAVPVLNHRQARHLRNYAHIVSNTHQVEPYAYFMYLYQEPVYFPGIVFGLVIIVGLAGIIRNRRQLGGPATLPWLVAVVGIVAPIAVHQYFYRYWVPVVPVACLAAGLAFAPRPARANAVTSTTPRSLGADAAGVSAQPTLVQGPTAADSTAERVEPPGDSVVGAGPDAGDPIGPKSLTGDSAQVATGSAAQPNHPSTWRRRALAANRHRTGK
jgi:hypothetical protein